MERQAAKISASQRQLWDALNNFIRKYHGWVVSPVDASPIRFQCKPGSSLPKMLKEMGYKPRSLGTVERLLPLTETITQHGRPATEKVARDHIGVATVEVYEILIPSIKP